jgi:hypothetical protein
MIVRSERKAVGSKTTGAKSMIRRIVLCPLIVVLLITISLAEAQQGRIYRVGVLGPPEKLEERIQIKGLRAGLREVGYVEGKIFS